DPAVEPLLVHLVRQPAQRRPDLAYRPRRVLRVGAGLALVPGRQPLDRRRRLEAQGRAERPAALDPRELLAARAGRPPAPGCSLPAASAPPPCCRSGSGR